MADYVLIDGDLAMFLPPFGVAMVVVRPGRMQGSGPSTWNGKNCCVDGDEKQLAVPGCPYITPVYSIPGVGTLKIAKLAANQKAKITHTGGRQVLLKGSQFTAKFEVQTPAQQPPPAPGPPIPDSMASYSGLGSFITFNTNYQAT
ncbi:MAG: hypothetical protein WCI11_16465 [Candidatus Methylumidiphilus sp.]